MRCSPSVETARIATPPDGSALDRMLQDPLIRLVMASDGVADADIRRLASRVVASKSGVAPARLNTCAGQA